MSASFGMLKAFLKSRVGIVLDADKHYLAQARLAPLTRRFGERTVEGLLQRLGEGADPALAQAVIEAMTTNETYFFRDRRPFDLFGETILPQLMHSRAPTRLIRVWCAGCATGQEPYSLAMMLDELAKQLAGWRVEILATDISAAALDTARGASYNQFEAQRGLPVNMLLRYFNREDDRWRLAEHLRARVEFRELNLMSDFDGLGPFDVIFCRNVLIYFDVETKKNVLERLARVCRPDGYLMLGAAESVLDLGEAWRAHPQNPGLNIRRPAAAVKRLQLISSH